MHTHNEQMEPCDFPDAILYMSFFKKGHVRNIGYLNDNDDCHESVCTSKQYNPFGKEIYYVYDVSNGFQNGKQLTYYSNGRLWKEGYYKNGKKTGTWKIYTRDGQLKKTRSFNR